MIMKKTKLLKIIKNYNITINYYINLCIGF